MEIPGLGPVVEDVDGYGLISAPVAVPVLGDDPRPVRLDEWYEDDPGKDDWHAAVRAFLALDRQTLHDAAPAVFAYYREVAGSIAPEDDFPQIGEPAEVWTHVDFSRSVPAVERDGEHGRVYVSIEAECAWEPEHGLQIVLRDGATVTKVGPFDGDLG